MWYRSRLVQKLGELPNEREWGKLRASKQKTTDKRQTGTNKPHSVGGEVFYLPTPRTDQARVNQCFFEPRLGEGQLAGCGWGSMGLRISVKVFLFFFGFGIWGARGSGVSGAHSSVPACACLMDPGHSKSLLTMDGLSLPKLLTA